MPNIRMGAHDFEPAIFSTEELKFLLDHMEEPPVVALNGTLPAGVNRTMVQKWMEKLYALQQLADHKGQPWAGFEVVKDSILRYLQWQERCQEIRRRGGPHIASFYAWDSSGGAAKFGIDSDSGFVRTEILQDGSRRPFTVKLLEKEGVFRDLLSEVAPWIRRTAAVGPAAFTDDLIIAKNGKFGKIECPICGKSEEFQTASKQAESMARARMGRHLKSSRVESARHRMLYRRRYESPDVKI